MDTMRYRPASSVPGTNRLSDREEEEEEEGVTERADPLEGVRGTEAATVRVANTSASTACPQVEQKRLFSAISLVQDGQMVMA
jgi:hypothetical protein